MLERSGRAAERVPAGAPAEPDGLLDTVGLYCPVPIIKTAARIGGMLRGQVLEILSDDRVILIDMPAWCRSAAHEYLGHFEKDGEIHLFVRKAGRSGWGT